MGVPFLLSSSVLLQNWPSSILPGPGREWVPYTRDRQAPAFFGDKIPEPELPLRPAGGINSRERG
jgi:hypothetical protein